MDFKKKFERERTINLCFCPSIESQSGPEKPDGKRNIFTLWQEFLSQCWGKYRWIPLISLDSLVATVWKFTLISSKLEDLFRLTTLDWPKNKSCVQHNWWQSGFHSIKNTWQGQVHTVIGITKKLFKTWPFENMGPLSLSHENQQSKWFYIKDSKNNSCKLQQ